MKLLIFVEPFLWIIKKQQQSLIETLKQNCRRIIREKTERSFTNINITRI